MRRGQVGHPALTIAQGEVAPRASARPPPHLSVGDVLIEEPRRHAPNRGDHQGGAQGAKLACRGFAHVGFVNTRGATGAGQALFTRLPASLWVSPLLPTPTNVYGAQYRQWQSGASPPAHILSYDLNFATWAQGFCGGAAIPMHPCPPHANNIFYKMGGVKASARPSRAPCKPEFCGTMRWCSVRGKVHARPRVAQREGQGHCLRAASVCESAAACAAAHSNSGD